MTELGDVHIRPMVSDDLAATVAAVRDGGWGDRRTALEFYLRHRDSHPLVAQAHGRIVGTAIASQNGSVGWVGLVFVAPGWRGRGLGGELTRVTMRCLEESGCRSIALAASELGRPIYDRLGFRVEGEYVLFVGPSRSGALEDARLRTLTPADLPAVFELDREASGEDRSHVIEALPDGWVLDEGHGIRGYALRTPWGFGPAITAGSEGGELLLELLRSQATSEELRLTTTGANDAAAIHLRALGFREEGRLPRMILGEPVPWAPERIWAIFNFALG